MLTGDMLSVVLCKRLGGIIIIDATVAADADIVVWYTIATATWRDRWWSLSEAISDAVD